MQYLSFLIDVHVRRGEHGMTRIKNETMPSTIFSYMYWSVHNLPRRFKLYIVARFDEKLLQIRDSSSLHPHPHPR